MNSEKNLKEFIQQNRRVVDYMEETYNYINSQTDGSGTSPTWELIRDNLYDTFLENNGFQGRYCKHSVNIGFFMKDFDELIDRYGVLDRGRQESGEVVYSVPKDIEESKPNFILLD